MTLRQWFRLRAISHLYWCSNSEVLVHVWLSLEKSIGEFSMVYKKMSTLIWLSAYNHDFELVTGSILQGYPEYSAYTLLFHARLVTCKSAKKWYLMRMCISWLRTVLDQGRGEGVVNFVVCLSGWAWPTWRHEERSALKWCRCHLQMPLLKVGFPGYWSF